MGYTHYWYREKTIPKAKFDKIYADVSEMLTWANGSDSGWAHLAGGDGKGKPVITRAHIIFNGRGSDSHETFYFPRVVPADEYRPSISNGKHFDFCKTAGKLYDEAVCTCLIIIKHYLGKAVKISSDGKINEGDWPLAIWLCEQLFGYGADFRLDEQ